MIEWDRITAREHGTTGREYLVWWRGRSTGYPDEWYSVRRSDRGGWEWKIHQRSAGRHEVLGTAGTVQAAKRRVETYDVERRIALAAEGWTLVYQEYVEDGETPGIVGQMGGITMPRLRKIKVKTHEMSRAQIAAILEHEIEHMHGAHKGTDHPDLDLRCGGRYHPFGEEARACLA